MLLQTEGTGRVISIPEVRVTHLWASPHLVQSLLHGVVMLHASSLDPCVSPVSVSALRALLGTEEMFDV